MAEYIDRGTFKESAEERYCKQCKAEGKDYNGCRCRACWVDDMLDEVDCFQPADVAPVVLGHWKKDRDTIKCTVCGFGMFPNRYTFMHGVCVTDNKLPKYCENCGAKMGTTEEQSV